MTSQLSLTFETRSPINTDRLKGQNKSLYEYLLTGRSIHCMHPDRMRLKIGYLNSRVSELINKHGIAIYKRFIKVRDGEGDLVSVTEYSMTPFKDIN